MHHDLPAARRIVVKLGSGVVAPSATPDDALLASVSAQLASAHARGMQIIVVSSGAVACGLGALGLQRMPSQILEKQAAAAVGQPELITRWASSLAELGVRAGQVLLTADDFEHRKRFLNATRTLETLLSHGIIPIVNENDSVSYDEIKLGDNDRLSALVASAVRADALFLLTTANGLENEQGRVIERVTDINGAKRHVRDERSATGTGGMSTKLDAAAIASAAGVSVIIAPGRQPEVITRLLSGERVGTRFDASTEPVSSRRRWIGSGAKVRGTLHIDSGAVRALQERGASLLPIGVIRVEGVFAIGDAVQIVGPDSEVIARGLSSYGSHEIALIAGQPTDQIERTLGYIYATAVVHRDDLSLTEAGGAEA